MSKRPDCFVAPWKNFWGAGWVGSGAPEAQGFKAYTPQYMAVLEEEGKPDFPVDLYNTGKMLRSMQTKQLNSRTAQIYFDNPEAAKKAAFNNETRPFFGFSAKEEKRLAVHFRKEMDK